MKVQSITKAKLPNYQTLDDFNSTPNLLIRHSPNTWKSNKILWLSLLSLSLNTQSCSSPRNDNKITRLELIKLKNSNSLNDSLKISSKIDSSYVAPLFKHGDGIGAFGCIVVAPPVFITEDDAKEIIINELKKENITFDIDNVPESKIFISKYNDKVQLKFDGYNKELNLAFCFISSKDYYKYGDDLDNESSVQVFNYWVLSEKIRNEIKKTNNINVVIFYEPLETPDTKKLSRKGWEELETKSKKMSVEALKDQIKDFIDWFKKEKF